MPQSGVTEDLQDPLAEGLAADRLAHHDVGPLRQLHLCRPAAHELDAVGDSVALEQGRRHVGDRAGLDGEDPTRPGLRRCQRQHARAGADVDDHVPGPHHVGDRSPVGLRPVDVVQHERLLELRVEGRTGRSVLGPAQGAHAPDGTDPVQHQQRARRVHPCLRAGCRGPQQLLDRAWSRQAAQEVEGGEAHHGRRTADDHLNTARGVEVEGEVRPTLQQVVRPQPVVCLRHPAPLRRSAPGGTGSAQSACCSRRPGRFAGHRRTPARRAPSRPTLRRMGKRRHLLLCTVVSAALALSGCAAAETDAPETQARATSQPSPVVAGVVVAETSDRAHVDGAIEYDVRPPVSGNHAPEWIACNAYDEPLPDEYAVHSLEHGAVWITYAPDLPQRRAAAAALAAAHRAGLRAHVPVRGSADEGPGVGVGAQPGDGRPGRTRVCRSSSNSTRVGTRAASRESRASSTAWTPSRRRLTWRPPRTPARPPLPPAATPTPPAPAAPAPRAARRCG